MEATFTSKGQITVPGAWEALSEDWQDAAPEEAVKDMLDELHGPVELPPETET